MADTLDTTFPIPSESAPPHPYEPLLEMEPFNKNAFGQPTSFSFYQHDEKAGEDDAFLSDEMDWQCSMDPADEMDIDEEIPSTPGVSDHTREEELMPTMSGLHLRLFQAHVLPDNVAKAADDPFRNTPRKWRPATGCQTPSINGSVCRPADVAAGIDEYKGRKARKAASLMRRRRGPRNGWNRPSPNDLVQPVHSSGSGALRRRTSWQLSRGIALSELVGSRGRAVVHSGMPADATVPVR